MSKAAAKRNTFPKTVEVEITDEENTIRMKQHLDVEFKIDAVKAERAAEMSEYTQQLKDLRKQRSELITSIQSKKEKRDIECYQVADDRLGVMRTHRADTDEMIDERALTLEERQGQFPFEEQRSGKKAKAAAAEAGAENPVVEDDYKPDGHVEGTAADKPPEDAGETTGGGKVKRIRASDVKKKKAERQSRQAVESNGAGEQEGA